MSWSDAWKILEPLRVDWPHIYLQKTKVMYELAASISQGCIVELGTHHGVGAIALALGVRSGDNGVSVYTIDDFQSRQFGSDIYLPGDRQVFESNLRKTGANVTLVEANVHEVHQQWNKAIGLLVRDVHDPAAKMFTNDFVGWQRNILPRGIFAFRCPLDVTVPVFEKCPQNENWDYSFDFPHAAVHTLIKTRREKRAAFWIVTDKYLAEAERSAASLAKVMPDVERWLFTFDDVQAPAAFNRVSRFYCRLNDPWYSTFCTCVSSAMAQMDAGHVLMLDSDTYFVDEVNDLFELLDGYDIAGTHAVGRRTGSTVIKIPDSFPELNTGVLAMRNNPIVRLAWMSTAERIRTYPEIYGNTDQAPFRETLWADFPGRIWVFPPEYHCRYQHGMFVHDKVRVLHGRVGDPRSVAASINDQAGFRTWNL